MRLPTKPMSKTNAAALQQQIEPVVKSVLKLAPAVYIGVWDPRTGLFMHAYGNAVRGGTRATVADHVRIGSITKTFTATVILQLVAQGKLSLGGTVARYDPALTKQFPALSPDSSLADWLGELGWVWNVRLSREDRGCES